MRDEISLLGIIMSLDKWIKLCVFFLQVPKRTGFVSRNFLMNQKAFFTEVFLDECLCHRFVFNLLVSSSI